MAGFSLRLLGSFAAESQGERLPRPDARRIPDLLALLALRGGEADKRTLASLLWPDVDSTQGGDSLRHLVRKTGVWLGPESYRLTTPHYGYLRLDLSGATIDVLAFDEAVDQWKKTGDPARRAEALALYKGPFLEGSPLGWAGSERTRRERIHEELGGAPEKTPPLPVSLPAMAAAQRPVPTFLTTFVGRDEERVSVRRALAHPDTRLLTLWGTGGVGKTRLACVLAVETEVPVCFLDLALLPSESPAEKIALLLADVLGKPHDSTDPSEDWIQRRLQSDRWLLIFDNGEHLIEGMAQIAARLLLACPRLQILATSRRPLGVPGEVLWSVPPLAEAEALGLFTDRARSSAPRATLDETLVRSLCQRLDGLPLAIELAAAQLRWLTLEQLDAQLSRRFAVLSGGPSLGPARHQALEATISGSWDLLSESERQLFSRLAVFVGSFTLEAAEAVCEGDLTTLTGLAAQSLLVPGTRFYLLESLRVFAADRLAEREGPDRLKQRFRDYYVRLFDGRVDALWANGAAEAMQLFQTERENLRQAMLWESEAGGGPLIFVLLQFWGRRNELQEALEALELAIQRTQDESERRGLLGWKAHFLYRKGFLEEACVILQDQVHAFQEAGDIERQIPMHNGLGNVYQAMGRWQEALNIFTQMRLLCLQVKNQGWLPHALQGIALAHQSQGDWDAAMAIYEESLALARVNQSELLEAKALQKIARLHLLQGKISEAQSVLAQSIQIARRLDDPYLEVEVQSIQASIDAANAVE